MAGSTHLTAASASSAPRRAARRRSLPALLLAAIGALALLGTMAAPALAARPSSRPSERGRGKGGEAGGGGGEETGSGGGEIGGEVGADISYPQCGTAFPSGQAFGIVGVNDGLANNLNPCLGPDPGNAESELYWAAVDSSELVPAQPNASLYVNTADPGNVYNNAPIADWPLSSANSDPYGACKATTVRLRGKKDEVGENSPACAWQYGFERATQDVSWLEEAAQAVDVRASAEAVPAAAAAYPWWLDVETANTWQSATTGQEMNVADLQGMVAGLQAAGAESVGIYSTESQWSQITGGAAAGSLYALPVWIPGASSLAGAESSCKLQAFTGGTVQITQWLSGSLDADHYCAAA